MSQLQRRQFLIAAGALLAAPRGRAQQPGKISRIGYLVTGSTGSPETRTSLDALWQGLREHGYVDGKNIVIEYRGADGKIEQLPGLAAELVRLKVDLIVAGATPAARAAKNATTTIPIVAAAMGDPVGDGLVASLARPGGNLTGSTFLGPQLVPKRMQLLKDALPKVLRLAALWHPGAFGEHTTKEMLKETEVAARALGVQIQFVGVRGSDEFDRAFSTMTKESLDALIVLPSPMLFAERKRVVDLATRHRLPAMFNAREFVQLGGLIAYGARLADLMRRAAFYADKILKGAKPSDLPVELPEKYELVINLKTAKALGITIPQSVLARADEVIR